MTFTVQEVPEWDICDISDEEFKMYDLTLPDILSGKDQCLTGVVPEEIKTEDPYQLSTSMMASSGDVHGLSKSYNSFYPQQDVAQSLGSSTDSYFYPNVGSSSYTVSPMQSTQQGIVPGDMMGYVPTQQQPQMLHQQHQELQSQLQQMPYNSIQVVPQGNEYGGYFNNYYMGKRRLRDDELNPLEYEKRRLRRERNKEAALRCRTRRRERIEALEKETSEIEAQNEKVEIDISKLQSQIEELKSILKGHTCKNATSSANSS